ncbi:FAR1-related sequence 5-like protein [Tanacetum coccineum]|uniref:FAR1-related sequence 5-like protein n=1 Tax=Tanacetum coccineum TaxID=301880 RepID=A0ABQ5E163_9ASTR
MDNIGEILQSVEVSKVMNGDDSQQLRIVEEGINAAGDAERVRFVVEDDLESVEGETDENEPLNDIMTIPKASLVIHSGTPCGSVYWQPNMERELIPVEGTYFETLDDTIRMYKTYAYRGGFEIKLSLQMKTRSGFVQHKYLMCNREGKLKNINIYTLKSNGNDKPIQKRNLWVTGCMARVKLDLDHVSGKYKLVQFFPRHNHTLCSDVYRRLSKTERKMVYSEKHSVMKAKTANIGATISHHIYSSMKGLTKCIGKLWILRTILGNLTALEVQFSIGSIVTGMFKSYIWFPESFLMTFNKQPTMVLTYQDRAMKKAIAAILP